MRVRAVRGSASNHACVACGNPAEHWSYRHNSPGELMCTKTIHGYECVLRYSPDPADYDPRCLSCHRTYDARSLKGVS